MRVAGAVDQVGAQGGRRELGAVGAAHELLGLGFGGWIAGQKLRRVGAVGFGGALFVVAGEDRRR